MTALSSNSHSRTSVLFTLRWFRVHCTRPNSEHGEDAINLWQLPQWRKLLKSLQHTSRLCRRNVLVFHVFFGFEHDPTAVRIRPGLLFLTCFCFKGFEYDPASVRIRPGLPSLTFSLFRVRIRPSRGSNTTRLFICFRD